MLSQEQIDAMIALSAPLVENPLPWSSLSEEQKGMFLLLMPQPEAGFNEVQRFYLSLWWLPVTSEQLDEVNTLCPPNTAIAPRLDAEGNRYIGADLLSDALFGGRLSALEPLLTTLPLTYRQAETWPVPVEEEGE